MKQDSVGKVSTSHLSFAGDSEGLKLSSGQRLGPVTLAYETYGQLNSHKNNAVLVAHAFSGDAHAAGFHAGEDRPGWWDAMIGPGKAIDTDRYFVVCSNIIGGCKGSTGPSSTNPKTGKPYGCDFPTVGVEDIVEAQRHLIDHLGIEKLLCVTGGSMGGMQALQWVATHPDRVASAIPIATALRHSPQQIAFNEVGRQAIISDPAWKNGHYYDGARPERGLAIARMIGHITYMSAASMEEKFSKTIEPGELKSPFQSNSEVEKYLKGKGDDFVKRFDANSYLYLSRAMDHFDLSGPKLIRGEKSSHLKFLVIAFKSDWLYPAEQSKEIVRQLKIRGVHASYCEINASHGHDSFLVEVDEQAHLVKHFLATVSRELD